MTEALDLETIIAELDADYTGKLPERAIREAQRRGIEMVPHLISLIRKATKAVESGEVPTGNGHLYALYLLTEFRAEESLASIIEAVSLPGESPFDLFGDVITEDLGRLLAVLTADRPEIIDILILDRSLSEYVRWQAARTYLYWVRDGHWTREEAVQRLRRHLIDATRHGDQEAATGLVAELVSYSPREADKEIEEAFRLELVDKAVVGEETVARSIAEGESRFQWELDNCRPTGIEDTVEELKQWSCFQDADQPSATPGLNPPPPVFEDDDWKSALDAKSVWHSARTIHQDTPRVGRNELCPCGSGKKYKKCCGRNTT